MGKRFDGKIEYPVYGLFRSSRGINWSYRIYSDDTVEQWHEKKIKYSKKWKTIFVDPTKELKNYIFEEYGIVVRN